MARRVGRRSAGIASRSAGSSRANRSGVGDGSPRGRTGNPPPTSSVSKVSIEPRHSAVTASAATDGISPRVHGTELRPDVEVDPARSERTIGSAAGLDRLGDLGLGHPELGGPGTDRELGERLGRDVRVEPVQDVESEATAGPANEPGQGGGLVDGLERDPA